MKHDSIKYTEEDISFLWRLTYFTCFGEGFIKKQIKKRYNENLFPEILSAYKSLEQHPAARLNSGFFLAIAIFVMGLTTIALLA